MTNYCEIETAKQYATLISYKDLGLDSEQEFNDLVNNIISLVSRQIDRFCHRPNNFFSGGTSGVSITEYHDGHAERRDYMPALSERQDVQDAYRSTFWLKQTPVIAITSIHENEASIGDSDSYTEITKYRFTADTGEVRVSSSQTPVEGTKNVRFIYTAGYITADLPTEIEQATAMLVANWLQAKAQQHSTQHVQWGRPTPMDFQRPTVFTQEIKDLLEPYRKKRTAML